MDQETMKSLTAPPSWTSTTSEAATVRDTGWWRGFKITRNDRFAEMSVYWEPTREDSEGVRIVVDEYPANRDGDSRERQFDITVDEDGNAVQSKINEIGETWIKAIDNEAD